MVFSRLTYQTLTVFLGVVLAKRYSTPSADIITVLAGLDEVDFVFNDFANAIESLIRSGRTGPPAAQDCRYDWANDETIENLRRKAIDAALALTSGAYQTSLVSYFTHRDLFPALMKVSNHMIAVPCSSTLRHSRCLGRRGVFP